MRRNLCPLIILFERTLARKARSLRTIVIKFRVMFQTLLLTVRGYSEFLQILKCEVDSLQKCKEAASRTCKFGGFLRAGKGKQMILLYHITGMIIFSRNPLQN
mmetsp:Transcript_33174/g.53871  ORF Transcript_33174/g.53871 Transcript_33174/m.53871 type:complete len:103 (-) Transcript_33174:750-1058(-)